ncbi:c-di-GMP-binding flagellar brake protein YcgR [Paraburkholderia sp. GAS41]|jgi:c-di-GMP-binding flagellar brake protein YcgR|uniref:flagellar brake protein n=1 Tax=Paraburkholderia sp. GAS41 TaxID=3035134 RepID=UPI003D1BBDEB
MNDTVELPAGAAPAALGPDTVPVGTPLAWPIVDSDGTLLFDAGAILVGAEERKFLFDNFRPQRGDVLDAAAAAGAAGTDGASKLDTSDPLSVKDMHLSIGALIGVRQHIGSAAPMHPCRIIGFAPNEALFTTPPLFEGKRLPLGVGENVEIVAIASQAVFRFVCTVEVVCQLPFDYVVLSKPGVIRRLRERKSIRVRARLPVRYGIGETGESYEGIGLAKGISALGMSLSASWPLGQVGDRLRVAYQLKSKDLDTFVETTAVIRNLQKGADGEPAMHGLELDRLDAGQQMAMKVFVFDRQDDVLYWTNGNK